MSRNRLAQKTTDPSRNGDNAVATAEQPDDGITPEAARQALHEAQQKRVERCRQKIHLALEQEKCTLDVAVLVTARGNMPQLNIIPQD